MAMRRAAATAVSAAARARARPGARVVGANNVGAPATGGGGMSTSSGGRGGGPRPRGRHRQQRKRRVRSVVEPSSAMMPPPRHWTSTPALSGGPPGPPPRRHARRVLIRPLSTSTKTGTADGATSEDEPASASKASSNAEGVPEGDGGGGGATSSTGDDASGPSSGRGAESSSSEQDGTGKDDGAGGGGGGFANFQPPDARDVVDKIATAYSTFKTELASTWRELLDSGSPRDVNKVIHPPAMRRPDEGDHSGERENVDDEAADRYVGSSAVMVVDEKLGAWERMQRRLAEAPIIKGILGASHEIFEKTGAANAKRKIDDIREDAAEAWETSQNPWVYRLSSVWDTVTAESEFALATRELQRLDPSFTLEGFRADVMGHTIPQIMGWFLEGKTKELKPWLGEAVYNRLAAEIRVRKQEGLIIDPHILGIENSEILAAEIDELNKGSPIILLHFMCQQINCVRKKDGTIAEGGEDEIRANSYIVALQREYDEVEGALRWKIVDFRFNGGIPWV